MTLSRREFGSILGASTLALPAQTERLTLERVRERLEARGELGIFDDEGWLEMLREAIERQAGTRRTLDAYPLSSDSEPTITFTRY